MHAPFPKDAEFFTFVADASSLTTALACTLKPRSGKQRTKRIQFKKGLFFVDSNESLFDSLKTQIVKTQREKNDKMEKDLCDLWDNLIYVMETTLPMPFNVLEHVQFFCIIGAQYDLATGSVDFFDDLVVG